MLEHAYAIEYDERPDYAKIKFMLQKILLDNDKEPVQEFNWRQVIKTPFQIQKSPKPSEDIMFNSVHD